MFFARHMLVGYVSNTFVNKTMFGEDPIVTLNDVIFSEQLELGRNIRKEVQLNYNEVELKDSHFLIWDEVQQEEHNFISVERVTDQNIRSINPTAYF